MTELTYGQRAVGFTFNPSSNPDVDKIKQAYASMIDMMDELRRTANANGDTEQARLASIAITDAQTAQMWAVKAVTWR